MKLNARLETIAGRIPACRILIDVGTDHAYIPIHAVESGICKKSIAADLREGPLKMAAANIRRHGLEKDIETRLGNGLEPVLAEECDVVVIAGMGGALIQEILSSSIEKARKAGLLLLQPNNALDVLRRWLNENGFGIENESLVMDAGKLYSLISAKWTGETVFGDEFNYYAGDILLKSGDSLLLEYIEKKIKELDVVIEGRGKSRTIGTIKSTREGISVISGISTDKCIEMRDRLIKIRTSLQEKSAKQHFSV